MNGNLGSVLKTFSQGLALSGTEADHVKEEILQKMSTRYSHVTLKTVAANDSCGAVFTAFKNGFNVCSKHIKNTG